MKAVILAGGLGTRLSEETTVRPKPMVDVGGKPILWHILKIYSAHGITDFVICLGYKGYLVKEYFANYMLHTSDVTFDLERDEIEVHHRNTEPWRVTLVETGEDTLTGGRLKRVERFLDDGTFCFTYGDGLADIDIRSSITFHANHGKLATVCAVQPPGRFGALILDDDRVERFAEKPGGDSAWINGGFFVLEPDVISYIDGDETPWELAPLEAIAAADQLRAFKHEGFFQPMDTLREKAQLDQLWESGKAPWKIWD